MADAKAKAIAKAYSVIDVDLLPQVQSAALARQTALVCLNQLIGSDGIVKPVFVTKEDSAPVGACDDVRSRFPEWDWAGDPSPYTWEPSSTAQDREILAPFLSPADTESVVSFLLGLKWRRDDAVSVAYVELAHLFVLRKFTLEALTGDSTLGQLIRLLKQWCAALFQQPEQTLLPGIHHRDGIHSCGRAIPKGMIANARPWISTCEMESFASKLIAGGGRTLSTWDFPLDGYGS